MAPFRSIRQAISYCGLCGEEKSSADKVMRTRLSKQRNKHIQRVLVEAAKLAPRQDHDLALVYETEKQKGNANRATLAVARKMVAYLLAMDRGERDFVPAEDYPRAAYQRMIPPWKRGSVQESVRGPDFSRVGLVAARQPAAVAVEMWEPAFDAGFQAPGKGSASPVWDSPR